MNRASLTEIVALARAGATDRALRLFRDGGFDSAAGEDAAVLTLKGRLLKDLAARQAGDERRRLYREAATAYGRAAVMATSSYPLINAASLSLLGGDSGQAAAQAREVIASLDAFPEEPETPYWRAATEAEALLLLGRDHDARAAFAEAVALAPLAWEDHASTLRQFALILEAQGKDASWLDAHRPPRSLHFGGHMSFDAAVSRREHLDETIAAILHEEKVGFGFGALAAGADIIVAEALLERGAELHAVLPGGPEAFAAVSVDPFGGAWRKRFDAVLERAATIRGVRPLGTPPDRAMIALADEVAMGAAAMNGRRLESGVLQLLVADAAEGAAEATAAPAGGAWRRRIVAAPREASAAASSGLPDQAHRRLALLTLAAETDSALHAAAASLADAPEAALGPYFTGRQIVVGYVDAAQAARVALALASAGAPVGGHYAVARPSRDPFSGAFRIGGDPAALAAAAAASAPEGTVCVTADFAAALAAAGDAAVHSELVGELDSRDGSEPVQLFALRPLL